MQASFVYGRGKENRAELALPPEESEDELVDSDEDNNVDVNLDESSDSSESESGTDTEAEPEGTEMEQFIGVCFYMSVHGLPKTRFNWNPKTRVEMVASTMTVNRWENIRRHLHFADNNQVPGGDKLFKVRPLLNFLNDSFSSIPMDEMLCVDEQMVPFKGRSQLKQYIPMKPKRWGYNIA
ncbi:hypothetical protein SKAU_G00196760 [Synaphobranchus kaupii]|uniref:PiggyBac transposable element-derived protein domain-containing protein n=1 Tax=Synaphobranchus kaupii TaxID=118154 RepID=A0A9Q1FEV5_SYNKA|nr:hypothetical protein SKAU_G00196760 [Synaphobranchus kaupii]